MPHAISLWSLSPEPPPGPKSHAAVVAPHLWEIVDPLYFLSLSTVSQRALLRGICKHNEWPWPQVSRALRHRAIAAHLHDHSLQEVEWTRSGIPIYTDCFAEPQPICPFKRRSYDLGHRTLRYEDKDCNSPSERQCGPRLAGELLDRVNLRTSHASDIYIAEAEWDDGLLNRMSQRRHGGKFNTFTYRDVDGNVSFIADAPMHGTGHPRTSDHVSPSEAIGWLLPRLWVPGRADASFSAGWGFPSQPTTGFAISRIPLDGLSEEQVEEFVRAADSLMESVGIPRGSLVPAGQWDFVMQALIAICHGLKS